MTGQTAVEVASLLDEYARTLPDMPEIHAWRKSGHLSNEEYLKLCGKRERVERRARQLRECWVGYEADTEGSAA